MIAGNQKTLSNLEAERKRLIGLQNATFYEYQSLLAVRQQYAVILLSSAQALQKIIEAETIWDSFTDFLGFLSYGALEIATDFSGTKKIIGAMSPTSCPSADEFAASCLAGAQIGQLHAFELCS